jgi:hypothetical protein
VTRLIRPSEQPASEQPAARQPPVPHSAIRPSLRLVIGIVSAVVLVAVAAGIGWAAQPQAKARAASPTQTTKTTKTTPAHPGSAGPATLGSFGWLASTTPPVTWARLTVPAGLGILSSPPGFRTIDGDPGTLSVGLLNPAGTYLGYLNVTPRQGPETLQNWATFRTTHLLGDDAVSVHEDAMVQSVPTSTAIRSCITDDYVATVGHNHFHEVACYVMNGTVGSVVVAATPTGDPAHLWTQLERAVAAYPSQ